MKTPTHHQRSRMVYELKRVRLLSVILAWDMLTEFSQSAIWPPGGSHSILKRILITEEVYVSREVVLLSFPCSFEHTTQLFDLNAKCVNL
ncbi:hypothetical protein IRJ41_013974 [Triplophysa rosa]|uniref:Uncharacterized protein n=1 Tax=Triplophysa rosa TaxID=992332 RepID=A0A9W8C6I0_TRIRA|nr:hypothetical protein IRJ41_013974 [Triplophysa rosa]